MNKVRYYKSFTDDFEKVRNFQIPDDYKWIRSDFLSRFLSGAIYGIALVFACIYSPLCLHLKIKGRKNLKKVKGGFFIYGNHTQPIGDVVNPALAAFPKRIYTVVSPENYGIPIIGKVLPYLGALPISNSLGGIKELNSAIEQRIKEWHPVVIYPEAHLWEYYTGIRPFSEKSFKFPAKLNVPVFSLTATYRKSKIWKKPVAEIYIDGPFFPEGERVKERAEKLCDDVYKCMKERSKLSNFDYIEYKKSEQ